MYCLKNELAVYAIAFDYSSVRRGFIAGTEHNCGGLVLFRGVIIMV